ncbi:MAG: glycosidase [Epulopiscium sp. Nele67-Bin005]|nr:MAG: glycosidase [Epulopiscium sp. Nele67-Bin005]
MINNKPMLNAYPDSLGGSLSDIIDFLKNENLQDAFSSFYILPSVFNTDLDRGFSVIDYNLNEMMATEDDLEQIKNLGIDLKLDFILNHTSVLSPQFQDLVKNGENSKYSDFFINWNKFWEGHGQMTSEGYIEPEPHLIKDMFFRKAGLPILMVAMPNGKKVPYWNTFYQEVSYSKISTQQLVKNLDIQYGVAKYLSSFVNDQLEKGVTPEEINFGRFEKYKSDTINLLECNYMGQMDVNIKSPLVWEFYDDTLQKLSSYGSKIVRLDAFAYAPKEVGAKNFLNDEGTWDLLQKVQTLADKYNLLLLPEIHSTYEEKIHELLSEKGYMTYDFFLPGLIIDTIENNDGTNLLRWANEIVEKDLKVVNMLGCHDGIPLLDLKGMLDEQKIQQLIDIVVNRGGYVKNLHGQEGMYYQVNATYYSALGEDDKKMLLARALQLFMPAKPQIWYLDLFCGKNDYDAVKLAGEGGHKEINRTNLSVDYIKQSLENPVVKEQLELIKFRNTNEEFFAGATFSSKSDGENVELSWSNNEKIITLKANLTTYQYKII